MNKLKKRNITYLLLISILVGVLISQILKPNFDMNQHIGGFLAVGVTIFALALRLLHVLFFEKSTNSK